MTATIRVAGRPDGVPASPVRSILVSLLAEGVPIAHLCGGRAQCGTCAIRVVSGQEYLSAPRPREMERLRATGAPEGARLACQTFTRGDIVIEILNPEKRVLMPELGAECSLDLSCPADDFAAFCDQHPDRTVVVYANTSAAVKARADWMVTSSIAVPVVKHLAERGEKILWAPDRYLGDYVQKTTGANMILWQGSCVVHEKFKAEGIRDLKREHPEAAVLVHPESPAEVIALADVVGSTTQLINAVRDLAQPTFIVATDNGIFHKMREAAPGKTLLEAPTGGRGATCVSCAHCPWMAMNGLRTLKRVLETGTNEIHVDPAVGIQAQRSIKRMLDFAAEQKLAVRGRSAD